MTSYTVTELNAEGIMIKRIAQLFRGTNRYGWEMVEPISAGHLRQLRAELQSHMDRKIGQFHIWRAPRTTTMILADWRRRGCPHSELIHGQNGRGVA